MLRYAEILDRVDVRILEVEHRIAAVAPLCAPFHLRHAGVVGGDRRHDDGAAVDVGHPFARIKASPRHIVPERMAERVDDVALEPVGRTQQLVNHELLRECRVDAVEVDRVEPVRRSHRLAADTFDAVVDEQLGIGQACQVAAHEARELGVDLPDAGDQSEPDLIAQVFGRAVRRILAERDAVGYGIFEDLLARSEHQRTDDPAHLRRDARQPAQPRAAQQVDEERLDRVVGMVGDRHGRVALPAAQGVEPRIAQASCRHFHRLARALHFGRGFEPLVVKLHAVLLRFLFHQHLVLFALGTPQLEIAVRHAHRIAAAGEKRQHDHRIHAPRNGQQDAVVVRRQVILGDIPLESL